MVCPQVDCPANRCRQLALHPGKGKESWSAASLKFHEYVYVTVLIEIAPQHRAEERQPRDAVRAGECLER